jgi:glycerophosphoryl diester phosphodiesterase
MKLMAHRGICWDYAENSLLSFRKALELNPDILEFDVRLSHDGILVIMHDDSLDRTTDSRGLITEKTLEEIKKAKIIFTISGVNLSVACGKEEPVPTLDETIELLKNFPKVLINCELKDYSDDCIKKTLYAFRSASMLDRTYFTCFDYTVLERIKALDPSLKVQGFPLRIMNRVPDKPDAEKLFDYVGFPYKDTAREEVEHFKNLGIITGAWTLDDPKDLEIARNLGVEIVTTNRLNLFTEVFRSSLYR